VASQSNRLRYPIIAAVIVALVGFAHIAVQKISTGPLRTMIEKNLSHALGLQVSVDRLAVALLPTPHLQAEGVRVMNPPGHATPRMLSIDRVALGIELWPLFGRIVVVDEIEIEGADLHLTANAEGRLAGNIQLGALVSDADEDSVQLELRELSIERLRAFYYKNGSDAYKNGSDAYKNGSDAHKDGSDAASYSLMVDSALVASEGLGSAISVELSGQFQGSSIALSGRIGSLEKLLNQERSFPVDFRGRLFESSFEARGTVHEPRTLTGLDIEISGQIPQLSVQGHPLPQLGKVQFGGHLSDLDGSLGFERLRLDSSKTVPVHVVVHGKMDDLFGRKEVDVELDLETLSLDFLEPLLEPRVEFPLPTIDSLSIKAKLSNQEGRLDLDGVVDAEISSEAIAMHAEGSVQDLTRTAKIDVALDARAEDLKFITSLIPDFPSHGTLGPVVANGRLESSEHGLAASGIQVRLGNREHAWAELDGRIGDVVALQDVEIDLDFGAQSLHHLKELLVRELPQTSPFKGSAAIRDKDGSLGLENLRLHGGEESPVEIHLEARFDDIPTRKEIEVDLGVRGENSRVLGAIAGIDLPLITPVEFRGKVKGSERELEVERMSLRLGETRLLGNLSGSLAPDGRPSVKARLTSKDVRMQDLGLVQAPATSDSNRSTPSPKGDNMAELLSRPVLPFEKLRHIDLDLGLRFDQVGGYQGLDARKVGFMLRLEDGDLVVTEAGAQYEGGDLRAELRVDARTPLPRLEAQLQTSSLNIARVMSQFDEESDYSGTLDAELELEASGNSVDALRRSLAGSVTASLRDGNAASRVAREFIVNLTAIVFPDWLSRSVPSIGCAMLDLEIEHGIGNVRTLILRGKDVGVSGTGEVDLVDGVYDLYVVPKARKPGILSVAPEVRVTGPLDDPQFTSVKRTLVTSFGRGLWHNAFRAGKTLLFPFATGSEESDFSVEDCRAASPEAN
jgi:uncharacterized protein involved in outer membrane biogenesis